MQVYRWDFSRQTFELNEALVVAESLDEARALWREEHENLDTYVDREPDDVFPCPTTFHFDAG